MMSIIAAELSDQDISDLAAWYASIEITAKMPPD
jgi:cytochrome c553